MDNPRRSFYDTLYDSVKTFLDTPFKPVNTGLKHFSVGDLVSKTGGDYKFDGVVVAAFVKLSGQQRYVVEDDRGILHIFSSKNLMPREQ